MSLLLALLAQVGPFVTPGPAPASPLPREMQNRRPPRETAVPAPPKGRFHDCLLQADADPLAAAATAQAWLQSASGAQRAEPAHCLGVALARSGRWGEAEAAFLAARDAAPPDEHGLRARLGAMAGNAALAGAAPERALAALDVARTDARSAEDMELAAAVQLDRARALVALKRNEDAATALEEARTSDPANAEAWLLSATLFRRMGKLAEAQSAIETAARLRPFDPETGLEAGVIAMLAGREDAARKSWQSVVAAAPESEAAAAAKGYLEQLGQERTGRP